MKFSVEQIKKMNDQEWNDLRNSSWVAKKEKNSGPIPAWYLKDKNQYISFMQAQKKKNEASGRDFKVDIDAIEKYDDKQWEDYRQSSWAKKTSSFSSSTAPEWFMKDKDQYISFLSKHNIK
ncbi:MAG: hypothetical protein Ta2E_02920 [Mycoplasmoidaceae bacterium]|nr:MAG: hypothetical protein Ta2E_02920 [Mycoplasmoidaceae bacterium]